MELNVWEYITLPTTKIQYEHDSEWYDDNWDNINNYSDSIGNMIKFKIESRSTVLFIPSSLNVNIDKYSCLIYYPGLGESSMSSFFNNTNWRYIANKNKFIVLYAEGTSFNNDKRKGFNIIDPEKDFLYTEKIISVLYEYAPNIEQLYFVGYSNGSMMGCRLAQKYGSKLFVAGCIIMGGLGKNSEEVSKIENIPHKMRLLIITGENDPYKKSCEDAADYFFSHNYIIKLEIIPNTEHIYPIDLESKIWDYLILNKYSSR